MDDLRLQCEKDLEVDGTGRDIYLPAASFTDWNKALTLLTARYRAQLLIDNKVSNFVLSGEDLFKISKTHTPTISFEINGVDFRLFFHDEKWLDFTVWPEQIQSPEGFETLLNFMSEIGNALNVSVWLTPEGRPDSPFLKYDHSDQTHRPVAPQ
jgi:hypothetical protein